MFSKTFKIRKRFFFDDIFDRILKSRCSMLIGNVFMDDVSLSYDLLSLNNECSVTLVMGGNTESFPYIECIILTMEKADVNVLNEFKRIWEV